MAPSIRKKLAITSPTSGGRSVGIVRSRTQTMEFSLVYVMFVFRFCPLLSPIFCSHVYLLDCLHVYCLQTDNLYKQLCYFDNAYGHTDFTENSVSTKIKRKVLQILRSL
jgi:hypothetical protein